MLTFPVLPAGGSGQDHQMPGQVLQAEETPTQDVRARAVSFEDDTPIAEEAMNLEEPGDSVTAHEVKARMVSFEDGAPIAEEAMILDEPGDSVTAREVCELIQRQHNEFMDRLSLWISRQELQIETMTSRITGAPSAPSGQPERLLSNKQVTGLSMHQHSMVPPPRLRQSDASSRASGVSNDGSTAATVRALRIEDSAEELGIEPTRCSNLSQATEESTQLALPRSTLKQGVEKRSTGRASVFSPAGGMAAGRARGVRQSVFGFAQELYNQTTQTPMERNINRLMNMDDSCNWTNTSFSDRGSIDSEDTADSSEDGKTFQVARNRHGAVRFTAGNKHSLVPAARFNDTWLTKFVRQIQLMVFGTKFEVLFILLVICNSIFMGIETNHVASNPFDETPVSFTIAGFFFTFVFAVELFLRLFAEGRNFFDFEEFQKLCWNLVDLFIVIASLLEAGLDVYRLAMNSPAASAGGNDGDMNKLRIVRIVRVARLMRLFRIGRLVRFVRALRTLVYSIICTLKSVVWSLLLLLIIMYIFGILFTQACTDYVVALKLGTANHMADRERAALMYHWGSLEDAMITLFMSISGGVSWLEVCRSLREVDVCWLFVFLIFISFTYFAVLNVVTGIFCQCAIENAQNDQESMVQAFISHKEMYVNRFRKFFHHMDDDDSGYITEDEFLKHIADPKVHAFFATLGIDSTDAVSLFKLIGTESVVKGIDIEDFVMGCLRLKGAAKSCDIARLMYENKMMQREISDLVAYMSSNFKILLGEQAEPPSKFFRHTQIKLSRTSRDSDP